MAQLSDTTNQSGLVQRVEFWSRLPYGSSGDVLRTIINNLNVSFDKLLTRLLSFSDQIRWDDNNHTDAPIGRVDIVSGQADYKITADDNTKAILNVTNVRILNSATATDYTELERMLLSDPRVPDVMSPNSDNSGTPTHFLEAGNRIYLYPEPNYAVSAGIELFFGREQSEFTVTGTSADDTTKPGIPKQFHELLALRAAKSYVAVQRPTDSATLNIIQSEIQPLEEDFEDFIATTYPSKAVMKPKKIRYI